MKEENYKALLDGIDQAESSTIPFPVIGDDEIVVVGDANETDIKAYDFDIEFQIPLKDEDTGKVTYRNETKHYKDVFITPRRNSAIVRTIVDLIPYFKRVDENGNLHNYTEEETAEILKNFDDEIYDRMYALVAAVLGIDDRLKFFMTEDSVWLATANIIYQYKATINEATTFFPQSSAGKTSQKGK